MFLKNVIIQKLFAKKEVFLFALMAAFGLIFSLTLLKGRTDPDFFLYYYIGKRISGGADMFADFFDNKGPVYYYFNSCLSRVFGKHDQLSLFASNWLLDSIAVFLIFKLLEVWTDFKFSVKKYSHWFLLFFIVAFYKSFSIGMFMGGTYSETLALVPLFFSMFLFEKKKDFFAGIFFSLPVLTRQTTLFYGIFFVLGYWLIKRDFKKSLSFVFGFLLAAGLILLSCLNSGNLNFFINNTVLYNLAHVEKMRNGYFYNTLSLSLVETRIILSLIFSSIFLILFCFKKIKKEKKFFLFSLFLSALMATFTVGIFYYHHFLQFSLFFIVCLVLYVKEVKKLFFLRFILFLIAFFTLLNYSLFLQTKNFVLPREFLDQYLTGTETKEYLMLLTYRPDVLVEYPQKTPDRYFVLFLSDRLTKSALLEREEHAKLSLEKLKKTLFLVVKSNRFDEEVSSEYLKNFSPIFNLEMIDSTKSGNQTIEAYVSKI